MKTSDDLKKPACENLRDRVFANDYELHKARYQHEQSSIEARNESGQWLVDHGFIGLGGDFIHTNRSVPK